MKSISRKIVTVLICICVSWLIGSCGDFRRPQPTSEILQRISEKEMDGPRISRDVAILIAEGLIAKAGFDLNLYRVATEQESRGSWRVSFILKERYMNFNVRCAIVYVDSETGEVLEHSYPSCNEPPVMEQATKATPSSMPGGSIGIYVGEEQQLTFELAPWDWEALFWDELGASDPKFAPDWQKIFSDSIPKYPNLSKIHGDYGSQVVFEGEQLDALMNECKRIVAAARNPIALDAVKRILTACELAKNRNMPVRFLGD